MMSSAARVYERLKTVAENAAESAGLEFSPDGDERLAELIQGAVERIEKEGVAEDEARLSDAESALRSVIAAAGSLGVQPLPGASGPEAEAGVPEPWTDTVIRGASTAIGSVQIGAAVESLRIWPFT
jgi:hypothetical protein